MKNEILFRPLADITEPLPEEPNLTQPTHQMHDLETKLTALVEEAKAAGAFAGIGTVPVDGGIKKEFYFTLRVPTPKPNQP